MLGITGEDQLIPPKQPIKNQKDNCFIKTQNAQNAEDGQDEDAKLLSEYWDVIADRREKKQLKDLEFLISQSGTIDRIQMNDIKATYNWT